MGTYGSAIMGIIGEPFMSLFEEHCRATEAHVDVVGGWALAAVGAGVSLIAMVTDSVIYVECAGVDVTTSSLLPHGGADEVISYVPSVVAVLLTSTLAAHHNTFLLMGMYPMVE